MSSVEPPSDSVKIHVNGRVWDPRDEYAKDARRTNYITITAYRPLSVLDQHALRELKVEVQQTVDDNTYLCRFNPPDLSPIRQLNFIRQVDVYRNKFKIVGELEATNKAAAVSGDTPTPETPSDSQSYTDVSSSQNVGGAAAESEPAFEVSAESKDDENSGMDHISVDVSSGAALHQPEAYASQNPQNSVPEIKPTCTVDIVMHYGINGSDVAQSIANIVKVDMKELEVSRRKVRMTVERTKLPELAKIEDIRAIEEVTPKCLHNNLARDIVWAENRFNNTRFQGEGEIIVVADTGFDTGSADKCHPAFEDITLELVPIARTNNANDPDGHGTHVCGTIAGKDLICSINPEAPIGGIAQKVKLVVQSLYASKTKRIETPSDLAERLFQPAYNQDARIHTNSWGEQWDSVNGQRAYKIADSEEVDLFVWENPETVILFSAGNDNIKSNGNPSIGAQAAAKNCITVGACGTGRVVNGTDSPDTEKMLRDSSCGPTKEGRIKPDVVAPGSNIISTCSQDHVYQELLAQKATIFNEPRDPLFHMRSGTSMSTPLVAGCAAIIREVLTKNGTHDRPAALIKAILINGATPLPKLPQTIQGFGRVNLPNSIRIAQSSTSNGATPVLDGFVFDRGLKQDDKRIYEIAIPEPKMINNRMSHVTFKITLVYSDWPGDQLQNNLNLTVEAAGGPRHGNGFEGEEYDNKNNVEQILWRDMPPGVAKVIVWARTIIMQVDSQPFALAWSISFV